MCEFHNFGLIFAGQMHCLPQRLKSTLFEIFSIGGSPKETRSEEKISKNVEFNLRSNHVTTQTHIWNWDFFHVLAHCANRNFVDCDENTPTKIYPVQAI